MLALGASILTICAVLVFDLLLGRLFLAGSLPAQDLVFPSFSRIRHTTSEFSYEAQINSLGFRDREFGPKKRRTVRIVCIGDSMTYGWGVEARRQVLRDQSSCRLSLFFWLEIQ